MAGMGYAKSDPGIVASGTEWRSATLAVTGLIEQQHQMLAEMKRLVASRAKVGDALVVLLTMKFDRMIMHTRSTK
jgi:hypothetical protein